MYLQQKKPIAQSAKVLRVLGRRLFAFYEKDNRKETQMAPLWNLKAELIRRFGTQSDAADALRISESRLSRIVRGRYAPKPEERQKLRKALGRESSKCIFER